MARGENFGKNPEAASAFKRNIQSIKEGGQEEGVELSRFQLRHIETQIGRIEEIERQESQIESQNKDRYNELKEKKFSALEIKKQIIDLDQSQQIQIAKALSANALAEGGVEQYALNIDGLTGLNKEKTLEQYLEKKKLENAKLAGLHFDIDFFKKFNDVYGHAAGDEVLKVTATVLKKIRGENGFAARNHDKGEEYTLLFTAEDIPDNEKEKYQDDIERYVADKAEELRRVVSEVPFEFIQENNKEAGKITESVTASIGVASLEEGESIRDFRNRMEHAATYAKKVGNGEQTRNQVAIYSDQVKNWHEDQIRQISTESSESFDALRAAPDFKQQKVDEFRKRQQEALESVYESSDLESIQFSNAAAEIMMEMSTMIEKGKMPEIAEFEKILVEKGLANQSSEEILEQIKNLWFMHASLAETNVEIFGEQARRDGLTGLYNRKEIGRQFEQALESSIESETYLSLIILDMDHFKTKINDIYGHSVGDVMLQNIAQFLEEKVAKLNSDENIEPILAKGRSSDQWRIRKINGSAGRWGGEEFVLIIPDMNAAETKKFVDEEIIPSINETEFLVDVNGEEKSIKVTLSLGIIDNFDEESIRYRDGSEMLQMADRALIACKLDGRNQSKIYSKEVEEKAHQQEEELKASDENFDERLR